MNLSAQKQRELTELHILPNQEDLLEAVREIRKGTDERLRGSEAVQTKEKQWGKAYPIGFCKEIRDDVLAHLQEIDVVRAFVAAGGVIEPFWGIDKGIYFQNAIQIGDAILDAANDTVNPVDKPPVVFYPRAADAPLKRIDSFEEYASVCEQYWHYDVYPNLYLPSIAPLFPLLAIVQAKKKGSTEESSVDGLIVLRGSADLYRHNVAAGEESTRFALAKRVLFDGAFSHKRVPAALVAAVQTLSPALSFAFDPGAVRIALARRYSEAELTDMANRGLSLDGRLLGRVKRSSI